MAEAPELALEDYRRLVSLDEPFVALPPVQSNEEEAHLVRTVLEYLERRSVHGSTSVRDVRERSDSRTIIRAMLTVRAPEPFPPEILGAIDALLQRDRRTHPAIASAELPRLTPSPQTFGGRVALWRGDITRLAIDAIVNAGNSGLLGCFRPLHACVDNAIHSAAGPRLREDCARIMAAQRHPEPPGWAKVTRAYNLPSRFVLHTVGPTVEDALQPEQVSLLARCYQACLDTAARVEAIRSVAFCGISTGVFGFPREAAARVALETVRDWWGKHPDELDLIVFVAFTPDDGAIYERALRAEGLAP